MTVIVEETIDQTTVEVVASGGKDGTFLVVSYGAESSAVERIVNLLEMYGYTVINSDLS